jgi:hypothetical protein
MEKVPGTHWVGSWVNLKADLDEMEKWKILTLPELEIRSLDHPAAILTA